MSDSDPLICWRCSVSLHGHPLPLSFRAECDECGADLHVCQLCRFYDTNSANQCREPIAERVANKTRNNYCDYFKARTLDPGVTSPAPVQSKDALDALFGLEADDVKQASVDDNLKALDDLFGDKDASK